MSFGGSGGFMSGFFNPVLGSEDTTLYGVNTGNGTQQGLQQLNNIDNPAQPQAPASDGIFDTPSGTFTNGAGGVSPSAATGSNQSILGPFSLNGANGSTLVLYSSSELGADIAATYAAMGGTRNQSSDGSNLNISIDIDQAATNGMAINDYVQSLIQENCFNNVVYGFHGDPTGSPVASNVSQAFGGSSGLANVVMQNLTSGGYVVIAGCYGTNYSTGSPNNPAWVQGIANAYGSSATVIVSGTGQTNNGEYDISPSNAMIQPSPGISEPDTRPAYWTIVPPTGGG
jgi:hypothetical protein